MAGHRNGRQGLRLALVPQEKKQEKKNKRKSCYKASSYKSEALRLWPQRCNTAKPRVSHKYSLTAARHATVVVAVPSTVQNPAKYKIKIYYLTLHLKCKWTLHTNNIL
jgi:hypothetical protein